MSWFCVFPFLRRQLDEIIDAEDGDGSFGGKAVRVDLRDHGFDHARPQVVPRLPSRQVESAVLQLQFLGILLSGLFFLLSSGVQSAQFGDQFGGVFGGIDGQGLRDDPESFTELDHGQLLFVGFTGAELVEMDGYGHIHGTSAGDHSPRFKGTLDHAD